MNTLLENNVQQLGQKNQWKPDCFIGQGYLRGVMILSFDWTHWLTSCRSSLLYLHFSLLAVEKEVPSPSNLKVKTSRVVKYWEVLS